MRFNLELIKTPESERVRLNLISRQPHSYGNIIAVVDTGSPKTVISARDASLLKISVDKSAKSSPLIGFGRGTIPARQISQFKFLIKSADNQIKSLEMPTDIVDIIALNTLGRDHVIQAYQIPTIIGLDFLRVNKLKLVIDFEGDSAYLEDITPDSLNQALN